jgi:hypothetical protein
MALRSLRGPSASERRWKTKNEQKEMDQALKKSKRCKKKIAHNMGTSTYSSKKTTKVSRAPIM